MRQYFEIKVQPIGIKPIISRTIITDSLTSFEQFHELIQDAFGLFNYHLWNFTVLRDVMGDTAQGETVALEKEAGRLAPDFCADKTKLGDLLTHEKQVFLYWYDFVSDWKFFARLQKISTDYDLNVDIDIMEIPLLIDSKGPDLLEDCGGNWGFAEIISVYEAIKEGKVISQKELDEAAWNLKLENVGDLKRAIFAKVKKLHENAYPAGRPLMGQMAIL